MKLTKKIVKLLYSVALLFFILTALLDPAFVKKSNAGSSGDALYYFSGFVMGVKVEMTLRGSDEANLKKSSDNAFSVMKQLDEKLSNWKEESEISLLNLADAGEWIKVSNDLFEVLASGNELSEKTGGAFDTTVGRLLELWDFYGRNPVVPEQSEIKKALEYVDYHLIRLDKKTSSVKLMKKGVKIDLGGIAKGYIMKKGYEVLRKEGIDAGLLNCSGDIYVWGGKPGGELWSIAIRNPFNTEKPFAVISVTDTAVFTSGNYERGFESGGRKYHHILDPRTGMSADKCSGVTVIGSNIDDVNALSSSLFIMGPVEGKAFAEELKGVEAVFFSVDGSAVLTGGFKKEFIDRD